MDIDLIYDRLWREYSTQNPSPGKIKALFAVGGEEVLNDHIAFRTVNDDRVNIDILASIFVKNGYERVAEYRFKQKHLFARHYEHRSEASAPKVFISELLLDELSISLRKTMLGWLDSIYAQVSNSESIIFAGNPGFVPSFQVYNSLREESEYAAWLYMFTDSVLTISRLVWIH